MKWIYKFSYPNGKIYIGKDLTGSIGYFGSINSKLLETDFSFHEMQMMTITRDILWFSETASDSDVNKKEVKFIRKYNSNNPDIGYNRWPKFIPKECHQ